MPLRTGLAAFAAVIALTFAAPQIVLADSHAVASGSFRGASGHSTKGGVSIVQQDGGYVAVLESDFRLDGAPDPRLGFGKDGYDTDTTFAVLESNSGRQEYRIPARIDPKDFNEFYVWCEKFSVPLGVAKLN